ncbi:MAG: SRPBCC family protein [Nonlabens sp.]
MITTQQEIQIMLPVHDVVSLLRDQNHFKNWQKGLVSFKNLTSSIGERGSKRRMKIKVAGTIISMTEEILEKDLPHFWKAAYRSRGVLNVQENRFRESVTQENKETTTWSSTSTFKFTGMMRLVAKARPEVFTGQTLSFMNDFKTFAEEHLTNEKT